MYIKSVTSFKPLSNKPSFFLQDNIYNRKSLSTQHSALSPQPSALSLDTYKRVVSNVGLGGVTSMIAGPNNMMESVIEVVGLALVMKA